jgi:hypothetical protein
MKLAITITYNSGEEAIYTAQPPEWAKWEQKTGNIISQASEKMGVNDLMFWLITHISEKQLVRLSNLMKLGWKLLPIFKSVM